MNFSSNNINESNRMATTPTTFTCITAEPVLKPTIDNK